MSNDTSGLKRTVPLLLRLALGGIFLYHGLDKVRGEGKDWGASWASLRYTQRRLEPPKEVLVTLERQAIERDVAAKRAAEKKEAAADDAAKQAAAEEEKRHLDRAAEFRKAKDTLTTVYTREGGTRPESLRYHAAQLAVAWGELGAGCLLLLGVLTRLSAVLMIVIQVGAIYTVTWARGFSFEQGGGFEYNLALVVMCAVLFLTGGGPLSVDHWFRSRRRRKAAAALPAPHSVQGITVKS